MTAKVDGTDITAENTSGTFVVTEIQWNGTDNQETKMLTIIGTIPSMTETTKTITLNFSCSEYESSLNLVTTDEACGVSMSYQETSISNPLNALIVVGENGEINIQEVTDNHIKGTFSFSGVGNDNENYQITDGFFDTDINM